MSKHHPKYLRKKVFRPNEPGAGYAFPFFAILAVLTVVSFIIPLRPTVSYIEKRSLAEFPEFSVEALSSGDYFDDISTWFSDTFPGRESWIVLASTTSSYHGYSEVMIADSGEDFVPYDTTPVETEPSETEESTAPAETETTEATEEATEELIVLEEVTAPDAPVEEWGGVNAGDNPIFSTGAVIQIGDHLFQQQGFSQYQSDRFISTLNKIADTYTEQGIRVLAALPPQSVGVLVEPEYLEKMKCADQAEISAYLAAGLSEKIHYVDTVPLLRQHNDEYIYFRTDHHWTALGAYYVYEAVCQELGMKATPLEDFELWDQGAFQGSLYWKAPRTRDLTEDTVYAYNPPGNLTTTISKSGDGGFEWTVLTDMSKGSKTSKYMTFLAGGGQMAKITNNDLPDAGNCVIIKDSFGTCLAPFFSQNYHNVYVVDYRYYSKNMSTIVRSFEPDDIIFAVNLGASQGTSVNDLLLKYLK